MLKKAFKINDELYNTKNITQGIQDFEGYAISFGDKENTITIEKEEDPQYVFDELMNYILSLSLENPLGA